MDLRACECSALFRIRVSVRYEALRYSAKLIRVFHRGCWLSHPLNFRFGRRGTIFVSAFFCFASVLGSAFTQTWPQLFICRLLLGIGMGSKASTIPVFAAENSPASIRGSLVMGWQLWVAFGILMFVNHYPRVDPFRLTIFLGVLLLIWRCTNSVTLHGACSLGLHLSRRSHY